MQVLIWDRVHLESCPLGIVSIWDCVSSEGVYSRSCLMSIRDGVDSGSCPFGKMSIQDRVHSGRCCPFGIVLMSIRDGVHSGLYFSRSCTRSDVIKLEKNRAKTIAVRNSFFVGGALQMLVTM